MLLIPAKTTALRPFPVVGHVPHIIRRGLLNVVGDVCGRNGDIGKLVMGPRTVHIISHPDHVRYVFAENSPNYIKGTALNNLRLLLGEGLVTSDGELWRTERNIVRSAFQKDKMGALIALASSPVEKMLSAWDQGAPQSSFEVHRDMRRLVFVISGLTLFGCDLSAHEDEATEAFAVALRTITDRNQNVYALPLTVPTPGNVRLKRAIATLDRHVNSIIESGSSDTNGGDVLSTLLRARGKNDRQLRDEVITLYLAGHDATTHGLTWVLHFLAQYPDLQQALREEASILLGGRNPTYEDLRFMTLTYKTIQESLRMRSPAALIVRQLVDDDSVDGHHFQAGSWVLISSYLTHQMPEFWPDPDRFDPERFTEEASRSRHQYAYYPFGVGPRTCIGNHLATIEIQLILAMILQRYEFTHAPGARVEEAWHGTLFPKGGLRLMRSRL